MPSLGKSLALSLGKRLAMSLGGRPDPSQQLLLYGLRGFSGTSYYATPGVGGEVGVATGFVDVVLLRQTAKPSTASPSSCGSNAGDGHGYYFDASGLRWRCSNNSAVHQYTPARGVAQSELGQIRLLVGVHTGAGGTIKMYDAREQHGADVACVGYYPSFSPSILGYLGGNGYSQGDIIATFQGRGVPSDAAIKAFYDEARSTGNMPLAMVGVTTTHRVSLIDQLRGQVVVSGQAAPATVVDTVTGAPADTFGKVGTDVTVVAIDPSVIDGRKTYGVQGFEAAAYVQSANGASIRGSAECVIGWYGRIDALVNSTAGVIAEAYESGKGWLLVSNAANNTNIALGAFDGGGVQRQSAFFAPAAGDVGQLIMLIGQIAGGFIRLFVKRAGAALVQLGSDVAITGFAPASAAIPMLVGARVGGGFPSRNVSHFGLHGSDGPATLAELQAWAADVVDVRGRMVSLAGTRTNAHDYDLTADIEANGGPELGVPATVLDRIGIDHLTRVGIEVRTLGGIRGVGPYDTIAYWASAPGGGITGAAVFHVVFDLVLRAIPVDGCIVGVQNASAGAGWRVQFSNGSLVGVINSVKATAQLAITGAHLNTRLRCMMEKTASVVRLLVNGVQVGDDLSAGSFNSAGALPMLIGQFYGGTYGPMPFKDGHIEIVQGGDTELTLAERASQFADLTVAPPIVAGKTLKRWRFEDDIALAGGHVPGTSVERISGGDTLVRGGAPLQVAQRVERAYSWETSPITRGVTGFTAANSLSVSGGPLGSAATGLHVGILCRVLAQTTSATRVLAERLAPLAKGGWGFSSSGVFGLVTFSCFNAPDGVNSTAPTMVIAPGDVGKLIFLLGILDPTVGTNGTVRAYNKRAQAVNGAAMVGTYGVPTGQPLSIGQRVGGTFPATDFELLGLVGGDVMLTDADAKYLYDDVMANERIRGVPGKSSWMIDFSAQLTGSVPSVFAEASGGAGAARAGTLTKNETYQRAWSW